MQSSGRDRLKTVHIYSEAISRGEKNHEDVCWPKVRKVSEKVRSANLGLTGYLLGLKHTVLSFTLEDGTELILDKTADMGIWFRRKSYFERLRASTHRAEVVYAEPRCLKEVYADIAQHASFDRRMRPDSTCQHFTRDAMTGLGKGGGSRELFNQKLFDRFGAWFGKGRKFSDEQEDQFLRYFMSVGVGGFVHERICSWRRTFRLERKNND
jgi:hypothetical protein